MELQVEQVADGVWFAHTDLVNWIVLVEGDRVALIDCGYPGQADLVAASVRLAGADPARIEALLLTHNHVDHTGSMPALAERGVRVFAGEAELPMLRGERIESATALDVVVRAWRPSVLRWGLRVARLGGSQHPHVEGALAVTPGAAVDAPWSPVPLAIAGHTSGHTAWWLPAQRAIVTGDALVTGHSLSRIEGPQAIDAFFHHDVAELRRTLPDLAAVDAHLILPGHGPALAMPIALAVQAALDAGGR